MERLARVRTDRVDIGGKVSLCYHSRLIHIGVGRASAKTHERFFVIDEKIRAVKIEDELLGVAKNDPEKNYKRMNSD